MPLQEPEYLISTGLLDGTPTNSQSGAYSNIIISASNGQYSSALPAFGVTVRATTGNAATLDWVAPTVNTNGTRLTDLAGGTEVPRAGWSARTFHKWRARFAGALSPDGSVASSRHLPRAL